MSTQRKTSPGLRTIEPAEEAQVASYLKNQPDFFERHTELLAHLTLPHHDSGAAVSLVERQTAIMRERNQKLESKLRSLVKVARTNQDLSDKIHRLSVKLMGTTSIGDLLKVVEGTLRQDFGSERTAMVLLVADGASPELVSNNFMRRVSPDNPALKPFHTFMEGSKPRCGQIRDAQKEFLFGPDNIKIGSAALLPIANKASLGILAIGNHDSQHFHPAMSTDFLLRLSQSIGAATARFAHQLVV